MIEMQPNARYVILGEDRAHASLTELVRYHQTVGIQPFMEILTVPCGQVNVKNLQPEKGMGHGLCPEQIESLRQHLSFVFPLWVSHSGQAAWPLLHALGNAPSRALGSSGVGERPWQWIQGTGPCPLNISSGHSWVFLFVVLFGVCGGSASHC